MCPVSQRWMTGFTVLGVASRLLRYLLHFPLWEDEAFLGISLAERSYRELMQPLAFHQVAPVPFLWIERAIIDVLGFNEWSLRLAVCVAGIASLLLFRRIVTRLLDGWARVVAYGVFAVAYPGIRYAAEAKPYGIDLLMSLLVLWCLVEWLATRTPRWLWVLTVVAPIAIMSSLPAAMIVGTASVLIALTIWRPAFGETSVSPTPRHDVLAWVAMNLAALAAGIGAIALMRGATESQLSWMRAFWADDFLPVDRPGLIPGWLLSHLAGDYLAVPVGGGNFGSAGTLLLVAVGVWVWRRERRRHLLLLALLPPAINLVLSAWRLYPFGGAVKFAMYQMPMVCVAIGAGASAASGWARRWEWRRAPINSVVLWAIAAIAVVSMTRDALRPYKTQSDHHAREWARAFWAAVDPPSERVDLKTDLHTDFSPTTFTELSWSAMYLANLQIYSPRVRAGQAPDWGRVSATRPLTVAEYHDAGKPYDAAARDRWLETMASRYTLTATDDVPMARYDKRERTLLATDFVRLYTFVPNITIGGRR